MTLGAFMIGFLLGFWLFVIFENRELRRLTKESTEFKLALEKLTNDINEAYHVQSMDPSGRVAQIHG